MNSDTMPTGRNMMPTGHKELENIPTLTQEQFDMVARKLTQGQLAHDTLQSIDLITDHAIPDKQKLEMIENVLKAYWDKTTLPTAHVSDKDTMRSRPDIIGAIGDDIA